MCEQRCVNQIDINHARYWFGQWLTVKYSWSSTKISWSRCFGAVSQQMRTAYGKVNDAIWDHIGVICCVFHTTQLINSPMNYRHILNICATWITDPTRGVRSESSINNKYMQKKHRTYTQCHGIGHVDNNILYGYRSWMWYTIHGASYKNHMNLSIMYNQQLNCWFS